MGSVSDYLNQHHLSSKQKKRRSTTRFSALRSSTTIIDENDFTSLSNNFQQSKGNKNSRQNNNQVIGNGEHRIAKKKHLWKRIGTNEVICYKDNNKISKPVVSSDESSIINNNKDTGSDSRGDSNGDRKRLNTICNDNNNCNNKEDDSAIISSKTKKKQGDVSENGDLDNVEQNTNNKSQKVRNKTREQKKRAMLLSSDDPLTRFKQEAKETKYLTIQISTRPSPPNRFGIVPGWRWDGVDRSNGFELRVLGGNG
ncbi:Bud13p ASCRUDRAFT_80641 [Ascoidea rubescens DSM 1968]|uniref:Pre-mRNA-splicing factor CWC26 n=1 Tax=Ascoidea rubescens DSM 1968 TaxID=1344418 RepID=A0A1D2VIY6_9ASCO|nr:hypothetical protein ASCRUDRAFT_80641 [Ascoidea rubescens DSM 1968]ODV61588.1 hypothetical protein ASCRUDRAFT_80641 [Ascoidea rubescens DSM 1968]